MNVLLTIQRVQQPMGGWHHDGHFFGMHFGWWILWAILLAVAIWAVGRAVAGRRNGRAGQNSPSSDPEEILRRRFAEGEIDGDEYRERLRELQEQDSDA